MPALSSFDSAQPVSTPPPCSVEEAYHRSAELRAAGRPDEALSALENCDFPQTAQLASARAQLLNETGRFAEAACAAAQAIELNPAQTDARFAQGFALYMLEQLSAAQMALDALVALEPGYPNGAWLRAGLLRRLRGDLDPAALAAYDLTLTVDPTNLYVRVERADILRAVGRYDEALAAYDDVISASDDEALRIEATFKRGCVTLVLNNPTDARAAFLTVLDSAPDYPDAREMYELLS